MKIILNGTATEIAEGTLAEAMIELGYIERLFATAVNGDFVRAASRNTCALKNGDRVEIVSPRQGG
jgi:sulfur carrier protein